jgi:uncharacterized protein involved in exopolysaccharide biosynthesis
MNNIFEWSLQEFTEKLSAFFSYLLSKWYYLIIGLLVGAFWGYWINKDIKPTYSATISFVLSTESSRGGGLSGIAAQLGLDAGTNGSDNIFSGDNIIELFKSQKVVRSALLKRVDTSTKQSLLNYIAVRQYAKYKGILPFPPNSDAFTAKQQSLFRRIAHEVANSFTVYKQDKRLIFYNINATSTDKDIAYYVAKCMLNQTSAFFIETKTSAATKGLKLLQKEADSIASVLNGNIRSTASLADRTYNINPSLMVQRSGGQFNQAKAVALSTAYTEVMKNLELAKINVQKETPLFGIIDEPDLPLSPNDIHIYRRSLISAIGGLLITIIIVLGLKWTKPLIKNRDNAK